MSAIQWELNLSYINDLSYEKLHFHNRRSAKPVFFIELDSHSWIVRVTHWSPAEIESRMTPESAKWHIGVRPLASWPSLSGLLAKLPRRCESGESGDTRHNDALNQL